MKNSILTLLCILTFINITISQTKETVAKGGVNNNITTSSYNSKMYDGTTSEEAQKHFDKAEELDKKDDLENAKKSYLKAIKIDSKFVKAYDNLGVVYRKLGEYDKAIESYKKSIELFPKGQFAHQNLAVVYGIQKNYEGAINEYKEILKYSPNEVEGYFGLANSYMMISDFDNALVNAEKALEIYKETNSHHLADGYYMIGLILYYKGDIENSKGYLKSAKDHGAKIHPQLEEELLGDENQDDDDVEIQLNTPEDYAKYEPELLQAIDWLMKTPVNVDVENRKTINAFVLQWITGSPTVSIELSEDIVTYMEQPDCLMMFLAGFTKYAIENNDGKNQIKGNLAGTLQVIDFYTNNKKELGKIKAIEKLIKLKKKGKLEKFIEKNSK